MQKSLHRSTLAAVLFGCATQIVSLPALADETRVGNIVIRDAWSRATPNGSKVGVGYVRLTNTGTEGDRLVSVSSDAAAHAEVHEMTMNDGVMTMRPLAQGIDIDPGETVELKPGSTHIMFLDLAHPLKQGQQITARFTFEHAGSGTIAFDVQSIGAQTGAGK